ncbi:protein of unknown function [Candidatus Nitrosocosmicus franklandus]|uniref:Uncharacterized protein n=1 Tax=Candidatus Nitrosocosmicus franklandianus TaxID=1798806 RepID=A0A484I8G6_9ARCH|nr:protein of unknown function [Candidatus Nitrosocosmicus franklandus]
MDVTVVRVYMFQCERKILEQIFHFNCREAKAYTSNKILSIVKLANNYKINSCNL